MIPAVTHGTPDAEGDWTVIGLPSNLQQQAVEFTTRQFAHLEQYWHPEDGSPAHPLSDGLHDATVHVDGDYGRCLGMGASCSTARVQDR